MIADAVTSPVAIALLVAVSVIAWVMSYLLLNRMTSARTSAAAAGDDIVKRVLRNSAIPIVSQLCVRFVDLGVAIVLLRLLGPEGNGRYALAVVVWLYVKTVSDFGLSLLATRDIARDHAQTGRLVGATTLLRLIILGFAAVPVGVYVGAGIWRGTLADESALAITILYLSIAPSSFSEAANAALNGHERMDVAALINIGVSLIRAPLVVVLAATELGVAGVALAALAAAAISADLFRRGLRRTTGHSTIWQLRTETGLRLARASWPLLVNALLINLFFRVDVFIVQAFRGDAALGVYDAAYKVINLVTILPAYVTLAIFPAMAARGDDPAALGRAQGMATYLLVWAAWGIVAAVSAGAGTAIRVLAGSAYLPEAATLLRILIWFAPLSFFNGVIQYVLVAAGQQHRIVPAFIVAVTFNLAANLMLVPVHGARAAAAVTVATELIILIAFVAVTRGGTVRAVSRASAGRVWRPTLAGLITVAVVLPAALRMGEAVAMTLAVVVFIIATGVAGVVGPAERQLLRRALARRPSAPIA
ncbi:MAG TPA: flippase [Thermomicrobiales bacterium]|nr:flippase [Thermomicrobiales bacterium]